MKELTNPHDAFIKWYFEQPEARIDFVKEYLPPKISACVDISKLELDKTSYVDQKLQESFSDVVIKTQLKNGSNAIVYFLIEHKSYPDPWAPFQLLRYMVRIWEAFLYNQKPDSPPQFLPIIFPVILYHGDSDWNRKTHFNTMFEPNQVFNEFLPNFRYHLWDLHPLSDSEIKGSLITKAALITLKHAFSSDFPIVLPKIIQLLKTIDSNSTGLQCLETFLKYFICAAKSIEIEHLKQILENAIPEKGGMIMATIAETLFNKGAEEGEIKGKIEGKIEALKETIQKMLIKGFSIEDIAQIMELPIEEIKKLSTQH
ncbi:MAG: Rpn family recombination-promoting nuclease/putative transposase [Candidatus Riflebacteria bacterium]|nr:Rpn family recombination-promoting nuclease/putative transposase [Candidatus Riflebacteria bacterium]